MEKWFVWWIMILSTKNLTKSYFLEENRKKLNKDDKPIVEPPPASTVCFWNEQWIETDFSMESKPKT